LHRLLFKCSKVQLILDVACDRRAGCRGQPSFL